MYYVYIILSLFIFSCRNNNSHKWEKNVKRFVIDFGHHLTHNQKVFYGFEKGKLYTPECKQGLNIDFKVEDSLAYKLKKFYDSDFLKCQENNIEAKKNTFSITLILEGTSINYRLNSSNQELESLIIYMQNICRRNL